MDLDKTSLDALLEISDALRNPSFDGDDREEHINAITSIITDHEIPEPLQKILRDTRDEFIKQQEAPKMERIMDSNRKGEELADAIEAYIGKDPYLYHGTIFGYLKQILAEGLIPNRNGVWSDGYVDRKLLEAGVFFSRSWRTALNWATTAHERAKGPRNSLHRTRVVLRIHNTGLNVFQDPAANAPGCLVVPNKVSVEGAHVIVGHSSGMPHWESIQAAIWNRKRK